MVKVKGRAVRRNRRKKHALGRKVKAGSTGDKVNLGIKSDKGRVMGVKYQGMCEWVKMKNGE